MKVRILGGRTYEVSGGGVRVRDVLRELGLSCEEYIVVRGGRVITEEDVVEDGDELVLYPVVSGG